MRAPVLLMLVLAIGLGFGTIQFARNWLQSERDALSAIQQQEVPELAVNRVLVTAGSLPSGHFLRVGDMRWQEWPEEAISDPYFTESEVALEELVGAVVRSGMNEGEPVTANRVVRPGDRGFLAGVLTPGMRAMAVPVNETTGIAGLVFPGDRVDLILRHAIVEETEDKATKRTVSETVLTNRRVLAIDQTVDDLSSEPLVADNVTLELTPR
ncbi:MAG: Flp pilus assembly protein CpaB, partial [Pseudomonadota bacterium]